MGTQLYGILVSAPCMAAIGKVTKVSYPCRGNTVQSTLEKRRYIRAQYYYYNPLVGEPSLDFEGGAHGQI